ncbi:amidohydrolase family protein [Arthrobacter sp. SD76]|uniref:amidohydrolase family protein n=1 Tax=Arthrobacter sp. SD76 TaxID=3415007 RepID=UPI003C70C192
MPHLSSFADDWRAQQRLIDVLVREPNVFADTSGVRYYDLLEEAIARAGARKVLYGSDGPYLHPAPELAKILALAWRRRPGPRPGRQRAPADRPGAEGRPPRHPFHLQEEHSMGLTGSPVTAAGLAEIKPHNDAAIRKGLYQLRAYLLQSKAARVAGTRPARRRPRQRSGRPGSRAASLNGPPCGW